ncbi:TonB-dependent receptor [Myroides marinus]|uniref:TonB-dependent receptor n=1 Tax=Myroides marinus TaxID=703342 RepID=UPI002579129C|nr:TonB-dependent receptor [Myroides marinus]MDM1367829.1 TonB-dependent receptor [Myroides marinus]MDM1373632.1 TonB-dependent receptor [Myroides marinus]MDM1376207.1 TonB-dependent receptor [Myroides marinus]MDM1382293.1 TonB-dependent receptor [Myroides marinus]MDM1389605.1 TonB-dependent receptor [Myroides marinus]
MNRLLTLLLLIFTVTAYSQSTFNVSGTVLDSLKQPVEAATVYLSKERDSTLVEYTMTDVKGNFKLTFNKLSEPSVLKVSMVGYKDFTKKFSNGISEDTDIKTLILREYGNQLDEVLIVATAPPIRVKKDTLEFNANSFKVRPDANLEELLKNLPGVQLDENKKITVNGKPVNEILVNGKPFFNEDGAVALENLPAEIIKKVQVTDKKTKKEKFTGEKSRTDDASINITIDEDKNKGHFGRVSGGYGSDKHYEAGMFLNTFNKRRKISLIGSANNINAVGFSMDKVFDNMRTGRSRGGLTESRMLGLNFVEDVSDKLKINGSYDYNFAETEQANKSSTTKFLPSGQFSTDSNSSSLGGNEGHRGNVSIDYMGEKDAFYFSPYFSKDHTYNTSESNQISYDEKGEKLNSSNSSSSSRGNSNSFGTSARYTRKLKQKGQYFSVELNNSNRSATNDALRESLTQFYQSDKPDDSRRQFRQNNTTTDNYGLSLEFTQPITDSLQISVGTEWNRAQNINDLQVFNYNEANQGYTDLNILETNRYTDIGTTVAPYVNFALNKNKYNINVTTKTQIVKNTANALYNAKWYSLDKHYVDPNINAMINYRLSKNNSLFGIYRYNVNYQSATQLLDITDISNPLSTTIGNPDLKPTGQHNVNLSYRSYNFQTRAGYSISANASIYDNSIVGSVIYDEDKKAISTYKNIQGNYQWGITGDWYKNSKWGEHALRYGIMLRYNQTISNGYIDGATYTATGNTIGPRVYLTYDYGEWVSIKPSYNYNHNTTNYTNFSVDKASNFTHRFNIQTTTYWPKKVTFGNDFAYNYNSQIAKGFKKDFFMWNVSLAYDFYKDKFSAKMKVYDVLNQNTSSTRTIDPMQIVDTESLVLKRYVMFSLTYKLNEFAGMKKGANKGRGGMGRPMRVMR